ncbi:MAG: hypothetical protein REI11_17240, partial [Patulibacter sp.]|nr:hypothetical protein [Patulibacter sp.]
MSLRIPPVGLVLLGIVSVQGGAGIAKSLFDDVTPTALTWLRLTCSALILVAIARPWTRASTRSRTDWLVAVAFGLALATMNWSIYQAFARIPLGLAVTFEFVGPLTLAVLSSRRALDLVWVAVAGVGVALLGVRDTDLDLGGVLFALLAGGAWASYILLSARTGQRWEGLSGLAVASVIAAAVLAPAALADHAGQLVH